MAERGRPIGSTGPREPEEAVQVFKPHHEVMVLLHVAGKKNYEIAEIVGCDKQTVSNILGDPKAIALIAEARGQLKAGFLSNIGMRVMVLANRSLDNLEKTVNANIPVRHPSKRHQDKVGLELLKMIGYGETTGGDAASNISRAVAERLTIALEKANQVREIVVSEHIQEAVIVSEKKVANG
jgi:hypothetical protein